jgi:hypothetical protein
MTNKNEVSEPIFEMDLMKRFQMMCSWSEFYLINKNKEQHDKIQKVITELRREITYRNTGIKQ